MANFPSSDPIYAPNPQAFTDKGDGYVRFEAEGKIYLFQMPLLSFVRLGREIQSEAKKQGLEIQSQSPANDQE